MQTPSLIKDKLQNENEVEYLDPSLDVAFSREEIEEEIKRQEKMYPNILIKDQLNSNEEKAPSMDNLRFKEFDNDISYEKLNDPSKPRTFESQNNETNRIDKKDSAGNLIANINKPRHFSQENQSNLEREKSYSREIPIERINSNLSKKIQFDVAIEKPIKPINKSLSAKQAVINSAIEAKKNAVVTFSKYRVGCSILTEDNKIITGHTTEDVGHGVSNCAEYAAISKARSMGYKNFKYLALASSYDGQGFDGPCKKCKSIINGYGPELKLILVKNPDEIFECEVKDLMPIRTYVDKNSAIQYDEVSVRPTRPYMAPYRPFMGYQPNFYF